MDGTVGNDVASPGSGELSSVRTLEARYMELLEKRIADLEARLLESEKNNQKSGAKSDKKDEATDKPKRTNTELLRTTNIRYRHVKYTDDGLENAQEVSEKEFSKVEQSGKAKAGDDLVWTRKFTKDNKYDYTEVQVVSTELQDLLRVVLSHDPRLHFSSDSSRNEISLTSPFEPLIHVWETVQKLEAAECDAPEWKALKDELAELDMQRAKDRRKSLVSETPETPPLSAAEKLVKARVDLTTLLRHIRSTQGVSSFISGLDSSKAGTVEFEYLFTIFPPGELVYSTVFMKQHQIFIVKESRSFIINQGPNPNNDDDSGRDRKRTWYLDCWSYDWNGKEFNRIPVEFKFDSFQGARKINTLPVYPLRYRDDSADPENVILRKNLIERGKLFREYCLAKPGFQMFNYEGDAISHGSGFQRLKSAHQNNTDAVMEWIAMIWAGRRDRSEPKGEIRPKSGRVMVDFESYLQHAPNTNDHGPMGGAELRGTDLSECHCGACLSNQKLIDNQRKGYDKWGAKEPFGDEQYLICPPRVLGYHLDSRTWIEIDVEKLQKIPKPVSDDAFKKLQLQKAFKDLIRNLVQSHISGTGKSPLMEDIVKNKGQGLVILLHGPPGVGKTLTAESVAAMAGKPLFAITTSDIGLDPADVEHNLESLFELAARWRAVLLFDEADVFLESRSSHTSDLTRNSLVSVLLRVLEYYSGILILTTNRINQFDIAVQSRVNLGIKYSSLTLTQKQTIFSNLISQVPESKIDDPEEILQWFKDDADALEWFEQLNGRQIRNILFSAGSLGMRDGECLRLEHVRMMAKHTAKFQGDLKAVVQLARSKAEAGRSD
ncbi:P-loop containing nucleoside triphosphate hydrolase protein [Amniculicola lignicola CBS 123094]|uniref:P-loop containing nucleoside triphosphate hydrolase protein n=1 Tax=Amniculicola lignicola CBS 123094 TaxID=1392246 RepID=A0A6A5W9F9_9PLEO|nr:P-loop containing nucleoside triphosphate hydrolase protein [Amniculicola lignicola CBS 123094]